MTLGMILYNIKQLFLFSWLAYIGGFLSTNLQKYPKKHTKLPMLWNDESSAQGSKKCCTELVPLKPDRGLRVGGWGGEYTFTKLVETTILEQKVPIFTTTTKNLILKKLPLFDTNIPPKTVVYMFCSFITFGCVTSQFFRRFWCHFLG